MLGPHKSLLGRRPIVPLSPWDGGAEIDQIPRPYAHDAVQKRRKINAPDCRLCTGFPYRLVRLEKGPARPPGKTARRASSHWEKTGQVATGMKNSFRPAIANAYDVPTALA
jgi:hypothetical protein